MAVKQCSFYVSHYLFYFFFPDTPVILVQLIENPPWIKRSKGDLEDNIIFSFSNLNYFNANCINCQSLNDLQDEHTRWASMVFSSSHVWKHNDYWKLFPDLSQILCLIHMNYWCDKFDCMRGICYLNTAAEGRWSK